MDAPDPTPSPHRRRLIAGGVIALMLALAGGAEAKLGVLHGGTAPVASAASVTASAAASKPYRYRKLRQLGVGAKGAVLTGRLVRVRISNKRPVEVRLAVVRDRQRKLQAWDAVKLKPGMRTLTRRLNKTPTGSNLNLRVTARIGTVRAREIIALKKVSSGNTGSSEPPTPFPGNAAPTALALSGSSVGENQPAGTTVGTLSASDPSSGDTLSFSLVGGAGSDDNAAFTLSGATLRTAASFDFETKSSYAIRVRVSDGQGGTLEGALSIVVTDVDDDPVAVADLATVGEDAAATPVSVLSNDTDSDGGPKAIASASNPANGTVVITGGGTGLTYEPDADYCNATLGSANTFTYTLNGGSTATVSMTVTCVNDAPVIASGGALNYSEGDPATPVDSGLSLSDVDSATITGATVTITANHASPQDVLAFADTATIMGGYNAGTGTLTLSGSDTVVNYRAALRAVTYRNTSSNPSNLTRTVTFVATDGVDASIPVTRGIAVSAIDNGPAVDNSAGALAYTENDAATAIDTDIAITDPDSTNLTGATVRITGNYLQGQDILAMPAQSGITALFDAPTGRLTLSGTATVAAYEAALETVTYRNTSENPSTAARTVTYQASDVSGPGFANTHGVTIAAVDDDPVAVDESATVVEDAAASALAVLGNDTDVDGGPKTISSTTQPANGTVVLTGPAGAHTGLTYQPNPNYCNDPPATTPDTFTYTLNGGSTATVSMTVTCAEDPPVAVNDSATVAEDATATSVDVLVNDTDIDGGPEAIASASDPDHGTVVLTGGSPGAHSGLTYQPDGDYCNTQTGGTPDTFTYELNAGSTATVSVTVTCGGDAPVAVNDSATVAEDAAATAIDVLANDSDADGDARTIASAADPANGTVVLTGPAGARTGLTYQPDASYCNIPTPPTDDFSYTVDDGTGGTDTATVAVTVTCVDDDPVAVDDARTVGEDSGTTTVDVLANDTDVDGGPKSIASKTDPAHGTVAITHSGADLTYTPDADYCNTATPPTDDFTYTLAPGGDEATVAVTVTCVDDDPTAADDSTTVNEDAAATTIDVLANDANADGGPKSIASKTDPAHGTVAITNSGADLTYEPDADYCNSGPPANDEDTFTYQLDPGADEATVSVTVTCVDDPPAVDLNAGGTGLDRDATFNEAGGPAALAPDAEVSDVDNANLQSAQIKLLTWPDGTAESIDVDTTGTAVTETVYDPATGILTLSGDAPKSDYRTVIRSATYANSDTPPTASPDRDIEFKVNDGTSDSQVASATVTVVPANVAPLLDLNDGSVAVGTGSSVAFTEGDPAVALAPNNAITDPDDTDMESATVTLTNLDGAAETLAVDATGTPITADAYVPGTGVLALSGIATKAQYEQVLATITYSNTDQTPTGGDRQVDFVVNDGQAYSNTATATVTVTAVPDLPVVTSGGTLNYTENAPAIAVHSALTVTEAEGDNITGASASITTNYQAGQDFLNWTDNNLADNITMDNINSFQQTIVLTGQDTPANYQAALRAITYVNGGEDPSTVNRTVTFEATDNGSPAPATGSDTRTISVSAVDDPPTALNDSATVLEDAAATSIPVLTNDTDPDAGPKTISSTDQPPHGTVVPTGGSPGVHTGLTYQPDPNYCNDPPGTTPDTFTYTLNGGSDATVSMTVTCVNDQPVADDETFNGNDSAHGNTTMIVNDPDDGAPNPTHPKTTVSGDILAGDTDVDGPGPLTVTPGTFATNDGGSVTVESDGDFSFHPAASTSCTDTSDFFDYTVEDSGSPEHTDTGRVTVAIAGCVWYVNNNAAGNSGTSSQPFDTLAQAEAASANNNTVFVFDGDNTSTGYDAAGYQMNSGEKLIGEHTGLVVDPDQGGALTPDTLHPANGGAHPTLTANNADVIDLDDGNELRGLTIDPQGTGGGIFGGAGDVGGTLDDVNVTDGGTAGGQAGLELNGTTGTFTVTDLAINNKATGVSLNNAGTTDFGSTTIISDGGPGLSATGTNMSTSSFDAITTTSSGIGGVVLTNLTGATSFGDGVGTDLSLTTTSGGLAAFKADNVTGLSVNSNGTDDVNATGGPAIDVVNAPAAVLDFDQLQSTNSANDAINLDALGTGTFSASPTSNIVGATAIAFDLNSGNGAISYPGSINNGSGSTAEITNRTGGAVTFVGSIFDNNDAGGGINMTGNTGGSTTFSNASKTLNTTVGDAVVFNNSDGHTLTFAGGGLDVDTTSGKGIEATTSGTLNITGSANTIDTGSGKALNVTNTDAGGLPLRFQRVSSNGANGGIVLNGTGTNSALLVEGNSGTCTVANTAGCSGGVIQNTTGADDSSVTPVGTGIVLNNTRGVSLTRMHIHDHDNYGIRGTNVIGLTVNDTVVNATDGTPTNGTSALTAHKDGSIRLEEITGTMNMTNVALSHGYYTNLMVDNTAGALDANLDNVDSGHLDTTGGDDAVQFEGIGTADMDVEYKNSTITTASGDLFQYIGDGTGGGDLDFTTNTLSNNEPSIATGGGGVALVAGAKGPATMDVLNNAMRDSKTNALTIIKSRDNAAGTNNLVANIDNNDIGVAATANSGSLEGDGMEITTFGDGSATFNVTNNNIRQFNSSALQFVAGSGVTGSGQFNLNISGNSAASPGNNPSITLLQGIRVDSGVDPSDTFATCVDFGPNSITGSSDAANKDFRLVASQNTTIRQPGYAGANNDGAAFAAFAAAQIGSGAQGTAVANAPAAFVGTGTTCP